MKSKFLEALKYIEENRAENLHKLLNSSYNKLDKLKKYYYEWYKSAEESGYTESAIINQIKYNLIDEAIKIKQWTDEQNRLTEEVIKILEEK